MECAAAFSAIAAFSAGVTHTLTGADSRRVFSFLAWSIFNFPGGSRERVRSGIAAARNRGVVFGRRPGQRVKADRFAPKVLKLVSEGQSYREISHRLGLSKNTILDIVKRDRVA
jgi:Homeodomain-like domain